MKRFIFLMCFLLAGLVRAEVPEVPIIYNAPSDYYLVISDKIFTCSNVSPLAVIGPRLPGAVFSDYSRALSVAAYYDEKWALTAVTADPPGLPQACILPLRSGASDVVYWAVLFSFSCLSEDYTHNGLVSLSCPGWGVIYAGTRFKSGMQSFCANNSSFLKIATMSDFVNFFADAQYSETVTPDPEPSVQDCVYTVIDREVYFVLPESPYQPSSYSEKVRGPALYATTKEAAEACADGFSAFLASYDWPWVGVPAVMPWTSPKVYKCIERFTGQDVGVFYRIVFQNYLGTGNDAYDTAYGQCLTDYSQVCGCGGLNVVQFVKPSAVLNDNVTGVSELNGRQLASASAGAAEPLSTVSSDVNFVQYTLQKVAAEDDVTGESFVTSTASASEGATINITNNTEVNTNLELGDAPDTDSFSTDEDGGEKEVKDSEDLLSNEETRYTYIDSSSTEKKIDWQKFWDDFKGKLSEIFGFEKVEHLFQQEVESQPLQDWTVTVFGQSFVLPWSAALNCQLIAIARSMLSAFCMLGTFFACFRLLA